MTKFVTWRYIKIPLEVLMYMCLFVGGLMFSWETITDYLKGSTSYHLSKEPISLDDLPTLSFCWPWKFEPDIYGENFNIEVQVGNESKTLVENGSVVITAFDLEFYFSRVYHRCSHRQNCTWMMRDSGNDKIQCFKISSEWRGGDSKDLQEFKVQLLFQYNDSYKTPISLYLYVTSEKNSYGLTIYQWFDGLLETDVDYGGVGHQLSPDNFYDVRISEVNEHRSIDTMCSDNSFFECVAKHFKKLDTRKSNTTVNGFDCQIKERCLPYSLPSTGKTNYPICQNDFDQACFDALLNNIVFDQAKFCQKLCTVKEFKIEVDEKVEGYSRQNTYNIQYRFKPIDSGTHLRTDKLLKNINTEFKIVDLKLLIGIVGGTLSMFVGVSFMAMYEFFFKYIAKIANIATNLENMTEMVPRKVLTQKVKYFPKLAHLGLLLTCAFFCWPTFLDFIMGHTQISGSTQSLSSDDIPALITCLRLKKSLSNSLSYQPLVYGLHFFINVTISHDEQKDTVKLLEKKYVHAINQFELHLIERKQVWSSEMQCFMIALSYAQRAQAMDFRSFKALISFHFMKEEIQKKLIPTGAHAFITSPPNSYGLGVYKLLDGRVEKPKTLRRLPYASPIVNTLNIIEVNEHRSLKSTCSKDSFYECLAKQFYLLHQNYETNISPTQNNDICSPFALPPIDGKEIPICENHERASDFKNILMEMISKQGYCSKKSCEVKEYQTELMKMVDQSITYEFGQPPPLLIELKFKTPTYSPLRISKPYKTVYEESWVVSWVSLIGIVGGTFGLFAGFSFIGVCNQMKKVVAKSNLLSTCVGDSCKTIGKNLISASIYICLLLSAITFSAISVKDYMNESKGYSLSQKDLSLDDLPALTICWRLDYITGHKYFTLRPLAYSKDIYINATISEKIRETIYLQENISASSFSGLDITLNQLQLDDGEKKQCVLIATKWNLQHGIDIKQFNILLALKFTNPTSDKLLSKSAPTFVLTSEQNSYGLVKGKWFDGKVYGENGKTSQIKNTLNKRSLYSVTIDGVTEYNNLDYACSNESYYQCLARRFENTNFSNYSNKTFNGTKCTYEDICTPFSMPKIGKGQLNHCKNDIDKQCYKDILNQLMLDQDHYCKKLCIVKEYNYQVKIHEDYAQNPNEFFIRYQFGEPLANRNRRSRKLVKTVKTEYLFLTFKSLFGSIGGTFGMFVGISFFDTVEWLIEFLLKLWNVRFVSSQK